MGVARWAAVWGALVLAACGDDSAARAPVASSSASLLPSTTVQDTITLPPSTTLAQPSTLMVRDDVRGFVVKPTRQGDGMTSFRVTMPNGQVADITLPGTITDAMIEPVIGLLKGSVRMGGLMLQASADGGGFLSGPCARDGVVPCSLVSRVTVRPGVVFEERQMGGTDRPPIPFVVFGEWAMTADADRAANFDFRIDDLGFPVVRAITSGYSTDRATLALYADGGAGRYRLIEDDTGACLSAPPPLACVGGVMLSGFPGGPGVTLSLVDSATVPMVR